MDMARKKRGEVKRIPIELDISDPAQRRAWEYWMELSEQGRASEWVRKLMVDNVPTKTKGSGPPKGWLVKPGTVRMVDNNHSDDPHYEPVDE